MKKIGHDRLVRTCISFAVLYDELVTLPMKELEDGTVGGRYLTKHKKQKTIKWPGALSVRGLQTSNFKLQT